MPRLRHYDNLGTARFVTFTCFRRHRYLTTQIARDIVLAGVSHLRSYRHIRILGWVVMPEHVHLVLMPPDGCALGDAIGRFKAWTSRKILSDPAYTGRVLRRDDGRRALWQRRCYDHNCRTQDVVREKINYCHLNPVKRELVRHPSDWPWSSYNWYRGEGQIVLAIDGLEL
ncbi:MAG: transposase [candidate division Zixibacteria bacterium]|nr:transposase [candidate division Zixibacteria bacterium]